MFKKALTFVVFLCLLSMMMAQKKDKESNVVTISKSKGNKGGNKLSPGVRKCMTIKCAEGFYCFHGRCHKVDYECIDKICDKGFRCNHGKCVKQMHEAQKQICKPIGFQQKRTICNEQVKQRCLTEKITEKICGFTKSGLGKDFTNQCQACNDQSVRYFFRVSCLWGPKVCKEQQECFNGICKKMFEDQNFKNNRLCNINGDCKINQQCAGHKCIDRRDLFNYMQSFAEVTPISLAI